MEQDPVIDSVSAELTDLMLQILYASNHRTAALTLVQGLASRLDRCIQSSNFAEVISLRDAIKANFNRLASSVLNIPAAFPFFIDIHSATDPFTGLSIDTTTKFLMTAGNFLRHRDGALAGLYRASVEFLIILPTTYVPGSDLNITTTSAFIDGSGTPVPNYPDSYLTIAANRYPYGDRPIESAPEVSDFTNLAPISQPWPAGGGHVQLMKGINLIDPTDILQPGDAVSIRIMMQVTESGGIDPVFGNIDGVLVAVA